MEPLWKTHLAADTAYDTQYHHNPRDEIVSFLNDPPGVVLDIGCGGGATGKLIKAKFPGTRVIGTDRTSAEGWDATERADERPSGEGQHVPRLGVFTEGPPRSRGGRQHNEVDNGTSIRTP